MAKKYEFAGITFHNKVTLDVYRAIANDQHGLTVKELGDNWPNRRRQIQPAVLWLKQNGLIESAGYTGDRSRGSDSSRRPTIYRAKQAA